MKARCFVLQESNVDVSAAEAHGDVTYIFRPGEHRPGIFDTERFVCDTYNRLVAQDFDAARDFFVVAGAMVPIAFAVGELTSVYGRLKLLVYSTKDKRYFERTIGKIVKGQPKYVS